MSAHVPVEAYRSRVESSGGGLSIRIPSRRIVGMLPTMFIGLKNAHGTPPPLAFMVVWTFFWALGGLFAFALFFWTVAGQEHVTVDADTFAVRREALGVGFTRRYAIASVRGLRVVDDPSVGGAFGFGRGDPFGLRSGSLAFDYGAKTIRFGSGIDAAEAKYIVSRVVAAKPALASTN